MPPVDRIRSPAARAAQALGPLDREAEQFGQRSKLDQFGVHADHHTGPSRLGRNGESALRAGGAEPIIAIREPVLKPRSDRTMNETSNVVRGILHPDGTLELAERPPCRPGRSRSRSGRWCRRRKARELVRIPATNPSRTGSLGCRFRTKEEIDADIEDDRGTGTAGSMKSYRQVEEPSRLTKSRNDARSISTA